eukprot:gb/GECG01000199.1/.p1 GENE.gb/GECG01000199.1/~~gb/GECG01000199.1/.p1  ORF type:complete len:208 (+),score=25.79 gb/GECG01000199.1/:1-624(+)
MLVGKRLAVFGVASQRSIAWGIANAWYNAGAQVAIGYQSERFKKRVEDLTKDWEENPPLLVECDVSEDQSVFEAMRTISESFEGRLDGLCHSIATSTGEAMQSDFVDTKRQDFLYTLDVSCYSMVALTREALPLLKASQASSVIGLSFLGGERAIKNYKAMGPAKAALEATCRSLAAELVSDCPATTELTTDQPIPSVSSITSSGTI